MNKKPLCCKMFGKPKKRYLVAVKNEAGKVIGECFIDEKVFKRAKDNAKS
jgi:hypothetical protein